MPYDNLYGLWKWIAFQFFRAFFAGSEHYQHWIDGGMMSMSIIYALHSLGVASCPLNWSQTPKADKALRKALKIENNQTVIMMIAVGYPEQANIVCRSSRRPFEEVFSKLELRNDENSINNNS